MPFRISRFLHAFLALCLASLVTQVVFAAPSGESGSSRSDDARALVVLVGEAAKSDKLTAVLSELLERERVALEFERKSRFRPSALLASSGGDSRVWVFISSTKRVAKLYFRGPFGNRFLLRKLELQNGLDEVGRELIAQVVETSILTLLRSEAGLSREQMKAGISDAERARREQRRRQRIRERRTGDGFGAARAVLRTSHPRRKSRRHSNSSWVRAVPPSGRAAISGSITEQVPKPRLLTTARAGCFCAGGWCSSMASGKRSARRC